MTWRRVRFVLGSLALGAALFGSLGASCYASNSDYIKFLTSSGNVVIKNYIDSRFVGEPNEVQAAIVVPLEGLVQGVWSNYINSAIAQDLPNNTIVQR